VKKVRNSMLLRLFRGLRSVLSDGQAVSSSTRSNACANGTFQWPQLIKCPDSSAARIGLGRLDSGCRRRRITQFARHPEASVRRVAPARLDVLTCDRPDAPKQSAKPGTTGELLTTGSMNVSFHVTERLS
jgi:hypothetical protein